MSGNYEHSKSFAILKRVKEQLDTNLTSGQYLQLLDTLLYKAVAPLVEHTNLFETHLCTLIGWQEKNNKRKVSLVDRTAFSALAVTWLLNGTNKGRKVTKIHTLRLDRAILHEFCRTTLRSLENYEAACNCEFKRDGAPVSLSGMLAYKTQIEKAVGATMTILPAIQECRYWLAEADKFKTAVLEKYIRLCLTTAKKDYVQHFDKSVPLDDIVQSYILIASRAIDKCDFRQGVLTSHIQNWFLTSRSYLTKSAASSHEANDTEELSSYEEGESFVDDLVRQQEVEQVRRIARLVDPVGYARAYLGIPETLEVLQNGLHRQASAGSGKANEGGTGRDNPAPGEVAVGRGSGT